MADLNKLILSGRATADCETRSNRNGDPIAKFRLATNKRNGEALFIDVVVFGKQAETASKYITRGKPLIVEGRLDIAEWEKDGNKYSKPELICSEFIFIDTPRDDRPMTQALNGGRDVVLDDIDDDKEIDLSSIPF